MPLPHLSLPALARQPLRGARDLGRRPAQRETVHASDGRPIAELTRRRDALTLPSDGLDGFEDWLDTHLAEH